MKTLTKAQRHVTFKKVQKKLHKLYNEDSTLVNYQYLCYEVAKTKGFESDTREQVKFANAMSELQLFIPDREKEDGEGDAWFVYNNLEMGLADELKSGKVTVGEVRLLALTFMVEMSKPTKKRK
jgi:hypothetical protein